MYMYICIYMYFIAKIIYKIFFIFILIIIFPFWTELFPFWTELFSFWTGKGIELFILLTMRKQMTDVKSNC